MTARTIASRDASDHVSRLQRGTTYRAEIGLDTITGVYLGMESPHGDLAILLRHADGTASIDVQDVTTIERAA